MAIVNDAFLTAIAAATERYEERSPERDATVAAFAQGGVLAADDREHVAKRLERLRAGRSLADALERTPPGPTTGRSLLADIPPERFDSDVLGLERLMGRNDMIDVTFLQRGALAARSVGRISIRSDDGSGFGTGFLIAPGLLLTNHHVLTDDRVAASSYVEFDVQAGLDRLPLTPKAFTFDPSAFFLTSPAEELDFTLVAVHPVGTHGEDLAAFGFLPPIEQEGKVLKGELVNIIQHPDGEPKQLAVRENQIVDRVELFLHYTADTVQGSSGSPVFNDQWELVALHHAGTPQRDAEGHILTTDGRVWSREIGEGAIAWVSNEGVRISRIVAAIRAAPLTGDQAARRDALLAGPVPGPEAVAPEGVVHAPAVAAPSARLSIPIVLDVSLALGGTATTAAPGAPAPVAAPATAAVEPPALREALVTFEANRSTPYYSAKADAAAAAEYYASIDPNATPDALYAALVALLKRTHSPQLKYKPLTQVYPWVDLRPDRQLRSIYSGKAFAPEDVMHEDARLEAALGDTTLEASLPYNCEHVVPQSSFAEQEPMRGDLHHLFTCESKCNSFRGNTPYFDFGVAEEVVREDCGRREPDRFEPRAGKGAAARATMYFLLRYPDVIGDAARELQPKRMPMLIDWHHDDPPGDWEHHRNMAIFAAQGNRNPLIDHPEWAAVLPFTRSFGG